MQTQSNSPTPHKAPLNPEVLEAQPSSKINSNFSLNIVIQKSGTMETQLEMCGDVFNFHEANFPSLEIAQDIFMRMTSEGAFFSFDGQDWQTFSELFNKDLKVLPSIEKGENQTVEAGVKPL